MKAFLAGLGIFLSLIISIAIYFMPSNLNQTSNHTQVLGTSIDLTEYFSQKGQTAIKREQTFGKLLATSPIATHSAKLASTSAEIISTSSGAILNEGATLKRLKKNAYTIAVL